MPLASVVMAEKLKLKAEIMFLLVRFQHAAAAAVAKKKKDYTTNICHGGCHGVPATRPAPRCRAAPFHVIVLFKARTAVKYEDNIHRRLHSGEY